MPHAPLIIDIAGAALTAEDRRRIAHPLTGGVILFTRNWQSRQQIAALTAAIRVIRPDALIAIDHEGGRVQRFITGFTRLPAMRVLGEMWDGQGAEAAKERAETVGWVLAAELAACGIDLSFTPVLDLDWGNCAVIGNRSFTAHGAQRAFGSSGCVGGGHAPFGGGLCHHFLHGFGLFGLGHLVQLCLVSSLLGHLGGVSGGCLGGLACSGAALGGLGFCGAVLSCHIDL